MQLSERVLRESESPTMAVGRRAAELRGSGVRLFDLGAGEPTIGSPESAVDGAIAALRAGHTRYTAVDGLLDLKKAVAQRYRERGAPWSGEADVVMTVGAKAALMQAVLALVDPGTEVVIPTPCWMTLQSQVRLAGGAVRPVAMAEEDGFALRAAPMIEAMTEKTRAVLLNSPCNPTGAVMAAGELRQLVQACADRGVMLISDETYGSFVYDEATLASGAASIASVASDYPDSVLLVSAFSKAFAMTGWRVGYALGPAALIAAMRALQSHITSNATSFAMHGALAALEHDAAYQEEHRRTCAINRDLVREHFSNRSGIAYREPEGAFYAFPRVEACRLGSTTAEMAVRLIEEQRVVVVPGEAFGAPGHLRISFAADREDLREGLSRLVAAL